jgi:hypothetical protein
VAGWSRTRHGERIFLVGPQTSDIINPSVTL